MQRLGNILFTGALPSSPGIALNIIIGTIPIDLLIEEEAVKGALTLQASNHWIKEPIINQKVHLTTHTKLTENILEQLPLYCIGEQDQHTIKLNMDFEFASTEIPEALNF